MLLSVQTFHTLSLLCSVTQSYSEWQCTLTSRKGDQNNQLPFYLYPNWWQRDMCRKPARYRCPQWSPVSKWFQHNTNAEQYHSCKHQPQTPVCVWLTHFGCSLSHTSGSRASWAKERSLFAFGLSALWVIHWLNLSRWSVNFQKQQVAFSFLWKTM